MLRPISIAVIVPLLVLFLGLGSGFKIVSGFLAAVFPVLINTLAGIKALPKTMEETALTFGLSERRTAMKVAIPYALPSVFVGLRLALAISLIVAVFSEMISGNTGVGYYILSSQQTLSVKQLYVGVFTLATVGYSLNILFLFIERRAIPWHMTSARRQAR